MKIISENIHVISKSIKEAFLSRDESFIRNLILRQIATKPDWLDLNIGPARGNFAGTMEWLVRIATEMTDIPLSLDSTNITEIQSGLNILNNPYGLYFIVFIP